MTKDEYVAPLDYKNVFLNCFLKRTDAPKQIFLTGIYDEISKRAAPLPGMEPKLALQSFVDWKSQLLSQPTKFFEFELPTRVALEVAGNKFSHQLAPSSGY